ncbi:MAG: DoxX family protein [Verrucomicrobiota bacterium]
MKQWIFGGTTLASVPADAAMTVLRVVTGGCMAYLHGLGKVPPSEGFIGYVGKLGFPMPEFFAWCAGISELICGIFLALGFATRTSAAFILFTMCVAIFIAKSGEPLAEREMAILYAAALIPFVVSGSGRYAIDRLIK